MKTYKMTAEQIQKAANEIYQINSTAKMQAEGLMCVFSTCEIIKKYAQEEK